MSVILATWEAKIRRIMIGGQPRQILRDPMSKTTRVKWTGGVAQVVERMLFKCQGQSSNPSTKKKTLSSATPNKNAITFRRKTTRPRCLLAGISKKGSFLTRDSKYLAISVPWNCKYREN
jgi:hypothetical protein